MNNQKIANPKKQVETGMQLNDKDYITDLLSCLKDIEKNYVIAMTEASNETLYHEIENMFQTFANLQREVYELMFRYGWYQLEQAEAQKINTKYQMLNQELQGLTGQN